MLLTITAFGPIHPYYLWALSTNEMIVGLHISEGVVTSSNHNGEAAAAITII